MVVLFGKDKEEQDMPVKLIAALRPDIHFKGGDYTIDQLPEAKVVHSYGGKVEIMPLVEGKSTTNIIGKMGKG
jgi:glycerol-3-phosphate cytidylyltransferase